MGLKYPVTALGCHRETETETMKGTNIQSNISTTPTPTMQ